MQDESPFHETNLCQIFRLHGQGLRSYDFFPNSVPMGLLHASREGSPLLIFLKIAKILKIEFFDSGDLGCLVVFVNY